MKYEEEIQEKGLVGPRITEEHVERKIARTLYHLFPDTEVTICCLILENGYSVTGTSACASPENFDVDLGKKIAYDKAAQKIWGLEAYLLKERMSSGSAILGEEADAVYFGKKVV